jgi:glucokinase
MKVKAECLGIADPVAVEKLTIALMAPGTGLGESLLVWLKDHSKSVPSERPCRSCSDHRGRTSALASSLPRVRFNKFLAKISVHVILNERAALPGAPSYASRLIK